MTALTGITLAGMALATVDAFLSPGLWGPVGLVLVCLLAAVLASILPGRRAANATPTEALAVD